MKNLSLSICLLIFGFQLTAQQSLSYSIQKDNSEVKKQYSTSYEIEKSVLLKFLPKNSIFQHAFDISDSTRNDGIIHYAKQFNQGNIQCTLGNWKCIGPTGRPGGNSNSKGTGQIHVLKFSPNYSSDKTVYAGSNFGGIWRKVGDKPWTVLNSDTQLAISSVSDIAIDPSNSKRIYISTGDGEIVAGHHAQKEDGGVTKHTPLFTSGMYRSDDGGLHWKSINGKNEALLDFFKNGGIIRRILIHPFDPRMLYIATNKGIFKTDDARVQFPVWKRISQDISDDQLKGFEFKPNDPNVLYTSGYGIYKSSDGGVSWKSMTGRNTGLDLKDLPYDFFALRINIATTKANPSVVYAYIIGKDRNGKKTKDLTFYIYRFDGTKWSQVYRPIRQNGTGIVMATRSALIVSPFDENEVYFGTTKLYGSKNINDKVRALSPYVSNEFHADVHALAFEPWSKNLFVGTDGGVHVKNLLKTNTAGWKDISDGLQISAIYKFDHVDNGTERIIIGNQDTGTYVYDDGKWNIIAGGDGFNGEVDGKSGIAFFSNSGDGLATYNFSKKKFRNTFRASYPKYEKRFLPRDPNGKKVKIRGVFNMINHPKTEKLIFSMSELFERQINGEAPDRVEPTKLWKVVSDIGKTMPAIWKRQYQVFDIAPSNPDYIMTAVPGIVVDQPRQFKDGFSVEPILMLSKVGGCIGLDTSIHKNCFENITQNLIDSGVKTSVYQPIYQGVEEIRLPIITSVTFHPENHLKAWVSFTGYEPGVKIWATKDGGETWFNADSTGSLNNIPVNCLTYQYGSNEMLYLGTDSGVWYKDAAMSDWMKYCDFPNVRVTDLNINYCMGKLRASTFGRSLWEGDLMGKEESLGKIELVIDEDTEWNFDRGLDRNLRVKSGVRLTIRGTIENPTVFSMPKNGLIIVEEGAEFRVIHAKVTNNCNQQWKGIQIWGDSTYCQIPEFQGFLYLQNAVIENAKVGIFIGKPDDDAKAGGIVHAFQSSFMKNDENMMSIQYSNPSNPERGYDTSTRFEGCNFEKKEHK